MFFEQNRHSHFEEGRNSEDLRLLNPGNDADSQTCNLVQKSEWFENSKK